jgi:Thaumatin family
MKHVWSNAGLWLFVAGCSAESDSKVDASSISTDTGAQEQDAGSGSHALDGGQHEVSADAGDTHPGTGDGTYDCRSEADGRTTAVFVNRCSAPLQVRGSDIEGGTVASGAYVCRDLGSAEESLPAKRYWGFLTEDPGAEHHTLAEFTFNTDFQDFDWYNISHVDAHNLTMQIVPLDRPDCKTLTCSDPKLLTECPAVGRQTDGQGQLISCVSPDRDNGNSEVALHFEACDDAYAWSGDDQNGDDPSPVRACAGEDWAIVFCP